MSPAQEEAGLGERVRQEVDRLLQRGVKGFAYLRSDAPDVGRTPKDTIHTRGTLALHHYRATTDEVYRTPVLLVMSLVSKPYILDLAPGQSLIEFLVCARARRLHDRLGRAAPRGLGLRLESYVLDFLPDCIERVLEDSRESQLSIVGYCMGGMLSAMYAALHPEGPLRNLCCFTTPFNFDGMGLMKRWSDPKHFDVDRIVDTLGNVPPELMSALVRDDAPGLAHRRADPALGQHVERRVRALLPRVRPLDQRADPVPGRVLPPGHQGAAVGEPLVQGRAAARRAPGRRRRITVPFLHVMAEHDHIVPYAAARELADSVKSEDRQSLVLKGGHVSLVAGPNAVRRMWPALDLWLAERAT